MITIDPNLRGCGVACWFNGKLISAAYVKNPRESGRGYEAHTALAVAVGLHVAAEEARARQLAICNSLIGSVGGCIIEHPRVYPGMPKIDLNDLLDVCGVGAAVALTLRHYGGVQTVFPSEWKGTMKKQAMLERIRSKLSAEELGRCALTNKSDNEDLLDAVGIGLWKLGRLSTKVYPGAVP